MQCSSSRYQLISEVLLKKYDKKHNRESSTFGSDCGVGNLIYGLTKMRYKQGKGDPAGLKHFQFFTKKI